MQIIKNYYAILGVSSLADERAIRTAYLALIAKYHPDVNPSAAAANRAAEITEAFSVLSKVSSRSAYDASRSTGSGPDLFTDRTRNRPVDGSRRSSRTLGSRTGQSTAAGESLFRTPEPRWPKPDSQQLLDVLTARLRDLKAAITAERATWRTIGRWVGALLLLVFLIWLLRAGLLLIFEQGGTPPLATTSQHAPKAPSASASSPATLAMTTVQTDTRPVALQAPSGPAPVLRADSVNNALSLFASVLYNFRHGRRHSAQQIMP